MARPQRGYLAYRPTLKPRSRALRRDPTPPERKLWFEFLRDLPQKFTRQKPLGGYIADFYCSRHKLLIEIDGDSHYTDEARGHDSARTSALNSLGIRVIRFTNADVMQRFEGACSEILRALRA